MSKNPQRDRCNTGFFIGEVVYVKPSKSKVHEFQYGRGGDRYGTVAGYGNPEFGRNRVRVLHVGVSQPYTYQKRRLVKT